VHKHSPDRKVQPNRRMWNCPSPELHRSTTSHLNDQLSWAMFLGDVAGYFAEAGWENKLDAHRKRMPCGCWFYAFPLQPETFLPTFLDGVES
jgi:hypothetical protein